MKNRDFIFQRGVWRSVAGMALLTLLTGCVGYVAGPRARVVVDQPVVGVMVGVPDEYIYYPSYDVYYNSSRREYAYMDEGRWVSRPQPYGVSVNVLVALPSVRMNFHDSPANHHAAVRQSYPRNWKPAGDRREQRHGQNLKPMMATRAEMIIATGNKPPNSIQQNQIYVHHFDSSTARHPVFGSHAHLAA